MHGGAIADYDPVYNDYLMDGHDYVVYQGAVFVPETDVNADVPEIGRNLTPGDPRNYNLKKHMVRLALYEPDQADSSEQCKRSAERDHEDSMKWLYDASKLRLNPQIPRKVAEDNKPVTDWQLATFQNDYDPYKKPVADLTPMKFFHIQFRILFCAQVPGVTWKQTYGTM